MEHYVGKRSPFMMIIDLAFVLMFDRFVEHYDGKRSPFMMITDPAFAK